MSQHDITIPVIIEVECSKVIGRVIEIAYASSACGIYDAIYKPTRLCRDGYWECVLKGVTESMPPLTPQISSFSEDSRLPAMDEQGYFSATAEAELRRKEWAEVTRARYAACPR